MSKKVKLAVIGTGNRYHFAYAGWIKKNHKDVELVAIADLLPERRRLLGDFHGLSEEQRFPDWRPLLEYIKDKDVDGVIVSTSDSAHYEPAIACLEANYHMLLEKPMTPEPKTCMDIVNLANQKNRVVMVAHVLRYTPFFNCLRDIIKSGVIGKVQSIVHNENIFSFHMAHSFVRGNWGNSKKSSPIILAKSCHDLDILLYIMGTPKNCTHVSAFGSLGHFKAENAPNGAPKQCGETCPEYKSCPYSVDFYYKGCFASSVAPENTKEKLPEALKTGDYGRCVYHCDNDVCDHMTSIMEFDDGVTIAFSLSAFTDNFDRTIKIMGSHGEIRGCGDLDVVDVYRFGKGYTGCRNKSIKTYHPLADATLETSDGLSGHGGGDDRFMQDFINALRGEGKVLTSASESLKSHFLAFALEEARINRKVVDMKEFESKI